MVTIIIGCSKSKEDTDSPIRAEDLYTGTYYTKSMQATSEYDDVRILSAKHGLISLSKKISKYDKSMYTISDEHRAEIIDDIDATSFDDEIHVYAGKPYVSVIEEASTESQTVVKPLSGGYGEQLSQLNEMI